MTLVRANTFCIIGSHRRRAGSIFEYDGPLPHKYLDIIEEGASAPSIEEVEEPKQQMGAKKQKSTDKMTIHEMGQAIPSVI